MDTKQITEALGDIFDREKHRIVFWYDGVREFEEALPELGMEDVCVLRLDECSPLEAKIRLEIGDTSGRYLLYAPHEVPAPENDWLIDIRLRDAVVENGQRDFKPAKEIINRRLDGYWAGAFLAEISGMLGVLPGYTALSMAALLPHDTLSIKDNGDVLADGKPTSTIKQRENILAKNQGTASKAGDHDCHMHMVEIHNTGPAPDPVQRNCVLLRAYRQARDGSARGDRRHEPWRKHRARGQHRRNPPGGL
ncbi:MAG: PglZ domain-containing protein [Desulfobacterales bacterium]|nr:PglZ domain-containing protein [Desulfobacterales bacterium]